jgi:hypothetical protein
MGISKKTLAAITGAIGLYFEAETQTQFAGVCQETAAAPQAAARPAFSPWVLSGRQSMMEMRQLFQRRLVH